MNNIPLIVQGRLFDSNGNISYSGRQMMDGTLRIVYVPLSHPRT
ncbi:hypothetical protein [Clostridium magnum]|nr:hypothetical protein [Clostridium magnum]